MAKFIADFKCQLMSVVQGFEDSAISSVKFRVGMAMVEPSVYSVPKQWKTMSVPLTIKSIFLRPIFDVLIVEINLACENTSS